MGYMIRGKRDGTGPYRGSFQRESGRRGIRQERGERCPRLKGNPGLKGASQDFVKINPVDNVRLQRGLRFEGKFPKARIGKGDDLKDIVDV